MKNKMGGAFSTHGENRRCVHDFRLKLKGRDHMRDLDVDWTIITTWILEK